MKGALARLKLSPRYSPPSPPRLDSDHPSSMRTRAADLYALPLRCLTVNHSSSHSAELAEHVVAVVFDPVLDELVACELADDDDGPDGLLARRRDAFPYPG